MAEITKEDILVAFQKNTRKRSQLVYLYYKKELFDKDLSAAFIAEKISSDLGISINERFIYGITARLKKGEINKEVPLPSVSQNSEPSPKTPPPEKVKEPNSDTKEPLILAGHEIKDASEEPVKKHTNRFAGKGL